MELFSNHSFHIGNRQSLLNCFRFYSVKGLRSAKGERYIPKRRMTAQTTTNTITAYLKQAHKLAMMVLMDAGSTSTGNFMGLVPLSLQTPEARSSPVSTPAVEPRE